MLDQLREIELLPEAAFGVGVLRARPSGQRALAQLELSRVAQAERTVDEQRRAEAEAIAQEEQPRLIAQRHGALLQERREVDHAVKVAANVRQALEPRARERQRCDRRYWDDFTRFPEVDQQ